MFCSLGSVRLEKVGGGEHLGDPDADDDEGHEDGCSANAFAEGLDGVGAADDVVVLLMAGGGRGFGEEELVGLMLRQVAAVDHESHEGRYDEAPEGERDGECVHWRAPEADVLVRDTERVQLSWARGVGWAGEAIVRLSCGD